MQNEHNKIQNSTIEHIGHLEIGDKHLHPAAPIVIPKELTAIPRLHPNQLIGREKDLQKVREQLLNQQQVVVVNGMGGLGKTALAQAYAMQYYNEYAHIAWVSFEPGSKNVLLDFTTTALLAESLHVKRNHYPKPKDMFTQLVLAMKRLDNTPCLLILDNAEETLLEYYNALPNQPSWHLLATSRTALEEFTPHPLGFLSQKHAVALFRKHYTTQILSDAFVAQLVTEVEYHTLTIEILAKMAQHSNYNEAQLRKALPSNLIADVKTRHQKKKIQRITDYLYAIFDRQLDALPERLQDVLRQLACLPSEHYTLTVLEALLVQEGTYDRHALSRDLNELVRTGWLLSSKGKGKTYKLHRIIQEVAGRLLGENGKVVYEQIEDLVERVSQLLDFDRWKGNPVEQFVWVPVGRCLEGLLGDLSQEKVIWLQHALARISRSMGNLSLARKLFRKTLLSKKKIYAPDDYRLVTSYANLSLVLKDFEELDEAHVLLEKAIEISLKHYHADHPEVAVRYSNLSMILYHKNEFKKARAFLENAIRIGRIHYDVDHPSLAMRYSNLSGILQEFGELEESQRLLCEAIRIGHIHYDKDHPSLAMRYSKLAGVLREKGELEESQQLLHEAIRIGRICYHEDHYTFGIRYSSLAMVLLASNAPQKALSYIRRAYNIFHKTFSKDHYRCQIVRGQLATIQAAIQNASLCL